MKGIARIAITIISQSRCLRSNFIITEQIVEAAVLSRKCGEKSQTPSSKTQGNPSSNAQINRAPLLWDLADWNSFGSLLANCFRSWDLFSQIVGCLPNHFPRLAQMLFGCENISQPNPHNCSTAQFCLCEIRATGTIDALNNFAVELVELVFVAGN